MIAREGNVDGARLADGLAVVKTLDVGEIFGVLIDSVHAGNAFQPALTALSTSAFDASAQTPMILPVAGVVTSYDFSPSAAIHSPSMKSPQQAR